MFAATLLVAKRKFGDSLFIFLSVAWLVLVEGFQTNSYVGCHNVQPSKLGMVPD